MPKVEVMCPSGMIAISELEYEEILESLHQRIVKAWKKAEKSGRDSDYADALELIALYNKVDEPNKETKAVEKAHPIRKLIAEYRAEAKIGRRGR